MIERPGRDVEPDDARAHDHKDGRKPEHAGHADLLGQGRRRSGRPALPMMHLRYDHDAVRRNCSLWRSVHRRITHETVGCSRTLAGSSDPVWFFSTPTIRFATPPTIRPSATPPTTSSGACAPR